MFITGAAHADVHTPKSDRGLVLGAANVDLMMGLYEVERSAGNERRGGRRMKCGGEGVFFIPGFCHINLYIAVSPHGTRTHTLTHGSSRACCIYVFISYLTDLQGKMGL